VKVRVTGAYPVKLTQGDAHEEVETLPLEGSDPRLGVGVHVGGSDARLLGFHAHSFHVAVEGSPEDAIVVVDQVFGFDAFVLAPNVDVADLLLQPGVVGVVGGGREEHAARTDVDEHQDERDHRPSPGPDGFLKEIAPMKVSSQDRNHPYRAFYRSLT